MNKMRRVSESRTKDSSLLNTTDFLNGSNLGYFKQFGEAIWGRSDDRGTSEGLSTYLGLQSSSTRLYARDLPYLTQQ
jgi:hypothetical protein